MFELVSSIVAEVVPVNNPIPLLLIILVFPVRSSNTLSLISDFVKETSIIFIVNATCLCLTSKDFINVSAIFFCSFEPI